MLLTFSNWLQLSEAHLYHGTTVDNEDSIKILGLSPTVGKFVANAYNDEDIENPELVFAADKKSLEKALTAMVYHIGEKLGIKMHDVTNNDIRNYGLLVIIDDGSEWMQHKGEDDDHPRHPHTVEPNDYYSDETIHGTRFVKGPSLIRLLNRYGLLPRRWGPNDSKQDNVRRGRLGAWAMARDRANQDNSQTLFNKVQSMSQRDVDHNYDKYRRNEE